MRLLLIIHSSHLHLKSHNALMFVVGHALKIGRPIQPRPVQAKEKTHYASVDRRNPYFWTKVSISAGPREPYGYCTGFGRGPLRPSIQCRIGVKICHTLESARHSYI